MYVNNDFKKDTKNFKKNIKIQNINLKTKMKKPGKTLYKAGKLW